MTIMVFDCHRYATPVFHLSALSLAVVYATLAWISRDEIDMSLEVFGTACTLAFLLSLSAAWMVWQSGRRITFRLVFYWCIVVRAIAILGDPIYEDDYYRYLWDGRQTIETGSPYREPPAAAFESEDDPVWSEVLDNINYPGLRTLYGPLNQYVFAIAYLIAPGEVFALQFFFACIDLLVIFLLARMAPLAAVVLYGFSPLIVKEFAMTAHSDVLSVAALLLATLAWRRDRLYLAAVGLAAAVASKLFALLLVPLLLRWSWRSWLVFFTTLLALYLPIFEGNGPIEALSAMATGWLFNAPIYLLLRSFVDVQVIKTGLLAVFIVIYAFYFFRSQYWAFEPRRIPRADLVFMGMLIALPVFNPWYYVFVLAYAVIYPSVWAWTGSATVLLSYVVGLQLEGSELALYEQPTWALVAEFIPILLAMAVPLLWRARTRPPS